MKSVRVQIWSQVEDQFWNSVWEQVELANFNQVWVQVRGQVWGKNWEQIGYQVLFQVRKSLNNEDKRQT